MCKIDNRMEQQNTWESFCTQRIMRNGQQSVREVTLLKEHSLELWINEQLAGKIICTPSDLEFLVLGRLASEGIITRLQQVEQLYLCESGSRVRVYLKEEAALGKAPLEVPTCCTDNQMYLEEISRKLPVLPKVSVRASYIYELVEQFQKDTELHKSTGGAHSCVLARKGKAVYTAEDIGRHNALDKAIGYALRQQLPREECILFTTGRVPVDMARKVIRARIPVLVSKSVPTKEAVDLAGRQGLTLVCRAWPDSFEVYSGKVDFC